MTERLDDPQRADKERAQLADEIEAGCPMLFADNVEGIDGYDAHLPRSVWRMIVNALRTPRSAVVASTQDELRAKYKASSPEERQRLIHEHDCPRVWDFWRKHASGSKLCPSCLMCGQQSFDRADWAITHLELPDIYICQRCVDKTRTPQSATERTDGIRYRATLVFDTETREQWGTFYPDAHK